MNDKFNTLINCIKCYVDQFKKISNIENDVGYITKKDIPKMNFLDKKNPSGSGSFSMNRLTGSLIGDYSHAEGYNTTASGNRSHAEGQYTEASGDYSHAEGQFTKAIGNRSHAEGQYTEASRDCSHAEGYNTTASGNSSHAEGQYTKASGDYSHAEGYDTTASGKYSHAEGYDTTASGECQHVQGKYNIIDNNNKYAYIVGNGTGDSKRSNAHTLDWDGNAEFQGDVTAYGCGGTSPISLKALHDEVNRLSGQKLELPKGTDGNVQNGEIGQFAVSDGNGGITWITLEAWQGGSY